MKASWAVAPNPDPQMNRGRVSVGARVGEMASAHPPSRPQIDLGPVHCIDIHAGTHERIAEIVKLDA